MVVFRKAERKRAKARIALCAPSGGGKTHSALLMAAGMGTKIAVIDTENGSAEMEAGKQGIPDYDVLTVEAPFDPKKYIDAIKAAEVAGYEVIIIDSLSHAWSGTGGLLEKKDQMTKVKGNNSFTAWREITPLHNQLVDSMLQSKCHVIATMRTKTEYTVNKTDDGKTEIKKMALAPVQRDGMDYEFTIVFDIAQDNHLAIASKDRTSLFANRIFLPTQETGKEIKDWLDGGLEDKPTAEQTAKVHEVIKELGGTLEALEASRGKKWESLTQREASAWITALENKLKSKVNDQNKPGGGIANGEKFIADMEEYNANPSQEQTNNAINSPVSEPVYVPEQDTVKAPEATTDKGWVKHGEDLSATGEVLYRQESQGSTTEYKFFNGLCTGFFKNGEAQNIDLRDRRLDQTFLKRLTDAGFKKVEAAKNN